MGKVKEKYNAGKALLKYFLIAVPLWLIIFAVPYYWKKFVDKFKGE